jgi:hypothetical protein
MSEAMAEVAGPPVPGEHAGFSINRLLSNETHRIRRPWSIVS